MSAFFSRIGEFFMQLMAGGTLEIILLIVLIIVALILFLVALWLLWKLLLLLGKGLAWLFKRGRETAQGRAAARREAQLGEPPLVATGWGSSSRIGLRRAFMEARRVTGPDTLRIVLIAGKGSSELCRSLDLTPPAMGAIRLAAGGDTLLIDASAADSRKLRRLVRVLPWRRPIDALAVLVDADGIPGEALTRAASFARSAGMRVALHFVLPSAGKVAAWRIIDANNQDGDAICRQLAADAVRTWLTGGSREGLREFALAQSRDLPSSLDRALAAAPSPTVDVASLSFSGLGLRGAVAQTLERTRPAAAPGALATAGLAVLVAGVALAILVGVVVSDRTDSLRAAVSTASREAASPWTADGIDAVPSGARMRRVAGLSARLAEMSEFSLLMPLASLVPNYHAPQRLGAAFLDGYVLRPLAAALERESQRRLRTRDDPNSWMQDARLVGEWLAAWEGLADDPREVDIRALLADAFGGDSTAWPEGIDLAMIEAGVAPPPSDEGGLDVAALTDFARANFVLTMQRWATKVYTNGPVATAARRASDRSANWRDQHQALTELRAALQDPSQQWLTAAEDRPDHSYELRILGRAVALSLIGQVTALEAKAAISRIRIDAREMSEYFVLPEIGPLLVRAGGGGGNGPSLSLTPEATAWLLFLDKIANSGFAPQSLGAVVVPPVGTVTLDAGAVAEARRRLQVFDQFAANLPTGLPPAVAQDLVRQLASELVVGVTNEVERALRLASSLGVATERAERRAAAAPALADLQEVEAWLRQRAALAEADRVLAVRARVAEGVLAAASGVLVEEDPLGAHLDTSADRKALARRFERGISRFIRVYQQLAEPFVEAASQGRGWVAADWRIMREDIAGYDRGDADSALTALEGSVGNYAEDPVAACDAPRPLLGRGDYLASALTRFRDQLGQECDKRALAEAQVIYERLKSYYETHVAWSWPYSNDDEGPEIAATTLSDFLRHLQPAAEALPLIDEPLAAPFAETLEFWELDGDGRAAVRFQLEWRARPSEELLAENIVQIDIEGAEADEAGVYTWRYGGPLLIRMRMAKNSSYRFAKSVHIDSEEWTLTDGGNGALLRVLSDLSGGALSFQTLAVDEAGLRQPLRITARISHADGRPMTLPSFIKNAPPLPPRANGANSATAAN